MHEIVGPTRAPANRFSDINPTQRSILPLRKKNKKLLILINIVNIKKINIFCSTIIYCRKSFIFNFQHNLTLRNSTNLIILVEF